VRCSNCRHVQHTAHGGRWCEDVRSGCRAHEDRAHRHATAGGGFHDVVQNVGRVQVGADQQVGRTAQRAVFQIGAADFGLQGRVAVQLAVALDVGVLGHEQVTGQTHLARRGPFGRTVARMREEGHLGHDAKALHLLRRHEGDLGQLLGAGVFVDIGVGDEERALVGHERVHGGVVAHARTLAQDAVDALQVRHVGACQAADHGVGIAQ